MRESRNYFLVFRADKKEHYGSDTITNRKLMQIAPGIYGSHITIIEGYTDLNEDTCKRLMQVGWGHRVENISPLYVLSEQSERLFSTAHMVKEFPGLAKYGGLDKIKKEYAKSVGLDPVYLDL